jgi:hypothetical protein
MGRPKDQDKAWAQMRRAVEMMKKGHTQTAVLGDKLPTASYRAGFVRGVRAFGVDAGKRIHGRAKPPTR